MVIALLGLALSALAQERKAEPAADALPAIVERGPHHRVIQRTVSERDANGRTIQRLASYTELATGLHYLNERGEWTESREEIEIFDGAAVARQGPHQLIFAANLNSVGAIDLLDPSGQRFRSHVLGLAYTDAATGRSVMIAEAADCTGAVLPPNQVIYQNALQGDGVLADVLYTYTLGAFEQDVILLTAPPPPSAYGLSDESSRMEVWTEFVELPEGTATPVVLKPESEAAARARMAEPDLIDQRLDFGVMKMEQGHAFPLGDVDPFNGASVPTGKSLERIDGRVFLIEKVDYADIRKHLAPLPKQAAAQAPSTRSADSLSAPHHADNLARTSRPRSAPARAVVAAPHLKAAAGDNRAPLSARALLARAWSAPKGARGAWKEKQYAQRDASRRGFVLDYIILNSSLTNFVFKADATYLIRGTANLYGTPVIEGLTVLKYTNNGILALKGTVDCRTDPYRPAFFVSMHDNTVGETITGSTGNPATNYAGSRQLDFNGNSTPADLHDLRFRHGFYTVYLSSVSDVTLRHCQFSGAYAAVVNYSGKARLRNALIHDGEYGIGGGVLTNVQAEQATFHRLKYFASGASTVRLTNALVIAVTNYHFYSGGNIVSNASDTGVFQTVGAAAHYLASGSTHRNAGTTNIHPALLADLKKRTTYPPIVLSNAITSDTVLSVQAQRDTDTPDLGYHYEPLDYVLGGVTLSNATLTLQTGTALGVHGGSSSAGLLLLDGGKVISTGALDNLNRLVRYNLVQEQTVTNWSASSVGRTLTTVSPYGTNLLASQASFRFTDFAMPAAGNDHLYAGATNLTFTVQDCQFHGGKLTAIEPDVTLLNNLFNRVSLTLSANKNPFTALVRNCTLAGGSLWASNAVGCAWTFTDNLFDTTNLVQSGAITHNYNAYLTNAVRLTPNGANDVLLTVTNTAYDTGWLGRFYLPTNLTSHSPLFNSGSQNATNAGLYHFTTTTNQVKETNSVVDIGFHAVALSTQPSTLNQPVDTDADGSADYLEDANGNGSVDSGETDWQTYNSPNGLTGSPGLQVFTPLK